MPIYRIEKTTWAKKIINIEMTIISASQSNDNELIEWIKKRLTMKNGPINIYDIIILSSPDQEEIGE